MSGVLTSPSVRPQETRASVWPRPRFQIALIVLVWAMVYVPGLFRPALLDDADSAHAEAAREMITRGDYVTLHVNGIRYFEKAPLPYWLIAGMFKMFGVSEWTARLPLALCALALLLAVCGLGSYVYGRMGGFFAALVLATGVGPYLFTRIIIPDLIVGLWLTLGMWCFLRTLEQERPSRAMCWAFAAAAGLDMLTKGMIGIVFPVGFVVVYLFLTRNLRHLLKMRPISSMVVFVAIAAPWHVMAAIRNPDLGVINGLHIGFLWFYFWNEQVLRYLNKRVPHDYDKVPLLVFWGLLLLWLAPWTAYVFQSLKQVPARLSEWAGGLDRRQRANLLFGLWALLILLFFSFSSRQEYYTIPAVPALALILGGWLERESSSEAGSRERRSGMWGAWALLAVGVVSFVVAVGLAFSAQPPAPGTDIFDLLNQDPSRYALSMGHFFDLTPQALGAFRGPLIATGVALLIGCALNWWFRRRGSPLHGNLALTVMMVAVLYCAHLGLIIFSPVIASKDLAMAIARQYKPGEIIEVNGEYEAGSTLNFYTGVQLRILNGRSSNLWYGSFYPDAPQIFDDSASFATLWNGPVKIYLWTEDKERPEVTRSGHVIARSGGKLIVSNRR